MKPAKREVGLCCFAIVFGTAASSMVNAQFELHRRTIDTGGVIHVSGGDFGLSGAIGQPAAGHMAGGDFQLSGGFWFGLSVGDCNQDGLVSIADHAEFKDCMGGPAALALDGPCACYDFNGDAKVDLRDFGGFQTIVNAN